MAAQKGLEMLIKVSSDGTSGGTMNTAGGMRSTSVTMNAESVDVTTSDSTNRFRELLQGAGVRSLAISGSGVFQDGTPDEDLRAHFFAGTHAYLQFIVPDFGTFAASFHIESMEFSGDHDGEVTFNASFASSGDVSWTAAV